METFLLFLMNMPTASSVRKFLESGGIPSENPLKKITIIKYNVEHIVCVYCLKPVLSKLF